MLVHGGSRARRPLHWIDCAHSAVPVRSSRVRRGLVDESSIVDLSLLEIVIGSKGRRCRRVGTDALALLGLEGPGPERLDVHPSSWRVRLCAVACRQSRVEEASRSCLGAARRCERLESARRARAAFFLSLFVPSLEASTAIAKVLLCTHAHHAVPTTSERGC